MKLSTDKYGTPVANVCNHSNDAMAELARRRAAQIAIERDERAMRAQYTSAKRVW